MIRPARTWAPANLALVKYWGKRDVASNLPATSSLSATLGSLGSEARIAPAPADVLDVQGDPARALRVIEAARALSGIRAPLGVSVRNSVPTAAGLASSASSMAALALALSRALGFEDAPIRTALLARLGSGSAVRSLHGGFVEWDAGTAPDGSDCRARCVAPSAHLPLAVLVVVCSSGTKGISSGEAMERCRRTSPSYASFLGDNAAALAAARSALEERNLAGLGQVAEAQSLRLHEILREADPPVDLLRPPSLAVVSEVRRLRCGGVPCFFSIDAGPSVAVFVPPAWVGTVAPALAAVPGVLDVLEDRVADDGARFLPEEP